MYVAGCGVGLLTILRLIHILRTVLDFLFFSGTWCGLHFPFVCVSLLLSAVLGLMVRKLGCGIGT
nr:MAG TPA: hypothetical protein [Caudoviricetes sp.]